MSMPTAFSAISLPERSAKPRENGKTMMIDWGLPVGFQNDVTAGARDYIDMAKIAATIPGVLPAEILHAKLAGYKDAGISTSPGGLFAEYAYLQCKIEPYLEEVASLGFSAVEISDNLLDWSFDEKQKTIRTAVDGFGLKVLGEVGRKDQVMNDDLILSDVELCLEAGSSIVFLEAYELFAGEKIRDEIIKKIADRFPADKIIYELPVVVLPGITREFKHKVTVWMVAEFGTEVNLANVEWDELWMTEIIRRRGGDNLDTGD